MNYSEEYKRWCNLADADTVAELEGMSEAEIRECFYKHLEFGTSGIRGVIGAGTNRMNSYVIKRATKGLADYILRNDNSGVVIAYDSRNFSPEFARCAADVLTGMGIKTYIFESLRPTPVLSFAVRYLKATAGIVITASHNPAKYNGYKVYWSDGGQIPPHIASEILKEINKTDIFENYAAPDDNLLNIIGKDVDDAFVDAVCAQSINGDVISKVADKFKVVYTPLHGSGNIPVRRVLDKIGMKNVLVVKEQELPNGNFPTVKSPNPEEKEGFNIAIELAKKNDVDLIIGTDPDSDRMGIVVRNKSGEYVTMTGNQVGIMLLDYILKCKSEKGILPENGAVVTTIVSTKMAEAVCAHYGVTLFKTLTGFKYIGEKIYEFEQNLNHEFLFGFEESYGYLAGTYCRDKDAVVASMLTCEMAAYYYDKGLTLFEVMEALYKKFGGYCEELVSVTLEGEQGVKEINRIMTSYRENPCEEIGGIKVEKLTDYLESEKTLLPKSDVLRFTMQNGVDFIMRPSGTEPKIKYYILSKGDDFKDAQNKIKQLRCALNI